MTPSDLIPEPSYRTLRIFAFDPAISAWPAPQKLIQLLSEDW